MLLPQEACGINEPNLQVLVYSDQFTDQFSRSFLNRSGKNSCFDFVK